ncbi:RNA polymerase sigma factor [Polyangium spumosum]|uniref:Sigma-70 family RNA polymerase sigma factor n=1 Tax=Polyangium spumosum TaxID=889282 RepID=A0A6N7PVG1_9BACT|nr:sigma-70 family RNA polymerase sigma factor [Polyangium spumosum]MRG95889.1 sigma-70 family RNA polymerase sigma factor [Polyangium spumosum]
MERAANLPKLLDELLAVCPELARFVGRRRRGPKAEDRFQEVMARAFARLPSYVPHEDGIRPWTFGIAKNVEREALRAERHERRLFSADTNDAEPAAGRGRTPEEDAFLAEARTKLTEAMSSMPERYLVVFVLVDLMDVPYEEAAKRLRIPIGTVKSRRSAAIDHLRYHLGEREDWIGALFLRLRRARAIRGAYEWAYQAVHVCGPIIFAIASMHGPEPEQAAARAHFAGAVRALAGLVTDVAPVVPDEVTPASAPSHEEPRSASPPPARPRTRHAPDAADEGESKPSERSTTRGGGWSL